MIITRLARCVLLLFVTFSLARPAHAQTPAPTTGLLRITVVDPSGAVIVGATVTVTAADAKAGTPPIAPAQTTDAGVATIQNLAPGRYAVEATFPGFEAKRIPDLRVRAGENKQVIVLPLEKLEASVTVGQDRQTAASDRQGSSFGTTLTRDAIEALSDDPAILQQQLQDMAGPDAVIKIDGFEGAALPAKAQIRSIRISRDQFAAENHSAGGVSIEIITQPGLGPLRVFANLSARNGDFSGTSPFVPVRGPERDINGGFGVGGTLIPNKSSFNVNVFGMNTYDTPNLHVALPDGTQSYALGVRTPRNNLFVNGQMDYALTLDQTLRFAVNVTRNTTDNLGVGGYDQASRAYATDNNSQNIRIQHFGPLGRRAFWRTRLQFINANSDSASATQAVTIRVNDAFTNGGAQVSGGQHSRVINLGSDLDYVLGRNSFRGGLLLNGGWYRSDASSNYLGTFTFVNLQAYLANQPSNFTRRIGDPNLSYGDFQAGLYFQDDIRISKKLTLSPGIRYEAQSHVGDATNVGPRFGVTYAPFAGGLTTFRGSVGIFYDWLPTSTYEQAQRVNGVRQQELNIDNPTFPDPGIGGVIPPTNRYLLGGDYHAPRTSRVSAGVDQTLLKVIRMSATYSYQRVSRLSRGLNLNPPIDGVRVDPSVANIINVVSDAASHRHLVQVDANINPGAMLPADNGPLVSWKRSTVFLNYSLGWLNNDTDGAFAVPATGNLGLEWGPASNDVRHRLNVSYNSQIVRNVLVSLGVNTSSAPPYTIYTGTDVNGDGIFNDRPAGIGRNTLRADGQTRVNLFSAYQFTFGKRAPLPPGIGVFGGGGTAQVRTFDQGTARYRLQLWMQAQNLLNQANYVGFSGTETSPFFGRPTAVSQMRKIDFGMSLSF